MFFAQHIPLQSSQKLVYGARWIRASIGLSGFIHKPWNPVVKLISISDSQKIIRRAFELSGASPFVENFDRPGRVFLCVIRNIAIC